MTKEKAIERIKNRFDKWALDDEDIKAIQTLIPELKESDDERIIKQLQEYVKNRNWSLNGPTQDEVLAYLEKQKEQSKQQFTHHEKDESLQDAVTHQMEDDGDVDDFVRKGIDNIALKYAKLGAEWQKEQKSTQTEQSHSVLIRAEVLKKARENKYIKAQLLWELMHNGIISVADNIYLMDDKQKPWTEEEYRIAYQKGFSTAEELQKSVEWNEDDYHWEGLVQLLRDYQKTIDRKSNNMAYEDVESYISWIKSIPLNLKKKNEDVAKLCSNEWSEEDVECYNSISNCLQNQYVPDSKRIKCLYWFKSRYPQPHWKPSEEQMEALESAVKLYKDTHFKIHHEKIVSLYEQLKKLM